MWDILQVRRTMMRIGFRVGMTRSAVAQQVPGGWTVLWNGFGFSDLTFACFLPNTEHLTETLCCDKDKPSPESPLTLSLKPNN